MDEEGFVRVLPTEVLEDLAWSCRAAPIFDDDSFCMRLTEGVDEAEAEAEAEAEESLERLAEADADADADADAELETGAGAGAGAEEGVGADEKNEANPVCFLPGCGEAITLRGTAVSSPW